MIVTWGAASDIGRVREGNEDAYLALDPLYVVADGMGGHRGGEVASTLALETIRRLFEGREGSLTEQVEHANRAVFERSQADRAVSGMGTTLTAALVEDERIRLAHVGDSRAYLFRDGRLHLITEDHTLVHQMVREGEITAEEAETHPQRSILTRALGTDDVVRVDEGLLEVLPGDRVLLCTDGLTGMVSERDIAAVLSETPDPQQAVDRLVRAANRAGGVDNITALLLDLSEAGAPTRPAESAGRAGERVDTPTDDPAPPATTTRSPTPPDVSGPGRRATERARLVRRAGIGAAIAVAALVLAIVALRMYLDTQWFVGVSDGRVAVFRGVPAEVAGFELHSVAVETTIPAEEAQSLAVWRDLSEGITADDRAGATAIVEQIRDDVERARLTGT